MVDETYNVASRHVRNDKSETLQDTLPKMRLSIPPRKFVMRFLTLFTNWKRCRIVTRD